jgi:hypothetical protein
MVLTRSMAAKLHNPDYTIEYTPNTYNPDNRISLVTEENIKNRGLILYDMYDIYNDIKYKSQHNHGVIVDNDLRPLLYSTMGIFYHKMHDTILKIKQSLLEKKWIALKPLLNKVLYELGEIDIQFRQTGVNCHFGDFNPDNAVLKGFSNEEISHMYDQWLTPYDIMQMDLFADLKNMFDNYIDILKYAVRTNSNLGEYFNMELCQNNFGKHSVYDYISNIKFIAMSD